MKALLTAEEERVLAARAQRGDQSAIAELVSRNERLALYFAHKYKGAAAESSFDDILQEARLGLLLAAQNYDGSTRFTTYASWWLRHAVQKYIVTSTPGISLKPQHTTAYLASGYTRRRLIERGTQPTDEAMAEELGLTLRAYRAILSVRAGGISLDATASEGDDEGSSSLYAVIGCDASQNDDLAASETTESIAKALDQLTPRDRVVIEYRYLDSHTLKEIGLLFGVSRERARQLEVPALEKMRLLLLGHQIDNGGTWPCTSHRWAIVAQQIESSSDLRVDALRRWWYESERSRSDLDHGIAWLIWKGRAYLMGGRLVMRQRGEQLPRHLPSVRPARGGRKARPMDGSVTTKQAASRLGLSDHRTITLLRKSGVTPIQRTGDGRALYWPKEAIETLQAQRSPSAEQHESEARG